MSQTSAQPPDGFGEPVEAPIISIHAAAERGDLVICAGAGLSRASPADLPSGVELGKLLDADLASKVVGYVSPSDPGNLLEVADAGADIPGGEDALRTEVLDLADFATAEPNLGHAALAALLKEGCVQCLMLWNWDDCVERAGLPELLSVARSYADLRDLDQPSVAKIHGCVTRKSTLLITSNHLDETPFWTDQTFVERLRGKTAVFVGIGDIAAYARRRLEELRDTVQDLDIWLVSPGIVSHWSGSEWQEIFPSLDRGHRIPLTADNFLDQLSRLWVRTSLDQVSATADANARPVVQQALARVRAALAELGPAETIRWARDAADPRKIGDSVIRAGSFKDALLGLAVLLSERDSGGDVQARSQAALQMGDERIELLVLGDQTGAERVRAIAARRAELLANQGTIGERATFAVAGSVIGDLSQGEGAAPDIARGRPDPSDVLEGPRAVGLAFLDASAALGRAA